METITIRENGQPIGAFPAKRFVAVHRAGVTVTYTIEGAAPSVFQFDDEDEAVEAMEHTIAKFEEFERNRLAVGG